MFIGYHEATDYMPFKKQTDILPSLRDVVRQFFSRADAGNWNGIYIGEVMENNEGGYMLKPGRRYTASWRQGRQQIQVYGPRGGELALLLDANDLAAAEEK